MSVAYYNEIDPFAAAWLRELVAAGEIAPGDVDERSIVDVRPADIRGYRQCHFFAGIGGWSLALRLAGWADDRAVWTGSCPCQPFSGLGRRRGTGDARHLWPEWLRLISECRPPAIFGEQVARGGGPEWLAGVRDDLEANGYAVGLVDLAACSVAAPQKRERLWFAAVGDSEGIGRPEGVVAIEGAESARAAARRLPWAGEAILGADGTRRRVDPRCFALAHGIPARMEQLRGYGNAIVPQVGALLVRAVLHSHSQGTSQGEK